MPVSPRFRYSKASSFLGVFQAVPLDDPFVPAGARLGDTSLGAVVHEHYAEAFRIALRPLEVVQERPDHVASKIHALLYRIVRRAKVIVKEGDALFVVHAALGVDVIVDGSPVLGDVDRTLGVLLVETDEELGEAIGLHRPAHRGRLDALGKDGRRVQIRETLGGLQVRLPTTGRDGVAKIVVDAKEVDWL